MVCIAITAERGTTSMRMTQFTASPDSLNRQGIPQGVSVERDEGGATTIRIRQGDDCTMVCVTYKDREVISALRAAMASLPKARPYYQLIVMDERGFWSPKFGDYSRKVVTAEARRCREYPPARKRIIRNVSPEACKAAIDDLNFTWEAERTAAKHGWA
jgi:hypothetical protein